MNQMTDSGESGDILLMDETLQGRVRSFSSLILKYQDPLFTFVAKSIGNREDAKDITQNVFVSAFSNLKKFRRECSFQTWLYRIAVNQIKNHWRNSKRRFVVTESELKPATGESAGGVEERFDPKKEPNDDESKQMVGDMISFLPLEQKQIFILYYIGGYSCREIAEIFKISDAKVKIQLFRGRQLLYGKFKNLFR